MEIEDFLKRAGKKNQAEPVRAEVIETKKKAPKPIDRAPIGRESVAEHVQEHMGSNPVGENSGRLGRNVADEIDSIEDHVHEVFDHKLGSLKQTGQAGMRDKNDIDDRGTDSSVWEEKTVKNEREAAAQAKRNQDIVDALRNPASIRQAIILPEVLKLSLIHI